jgi:hypothetical protein
VRGLDGGEASKTAPDVQEALGGCWGFLEGATAPWDTGPVSPAARDLSETSRLPYFLKAEIGAADPRAGSRTRATRPVPSLISSPESRRPGAIRTRGVVLSCIGRARSGRNLEDTEGSPGIYVRGHRVSRW